MGTDFGKSITALIVMCMIIGGWIYFESRAAKLANQDKSAEQESARCSCKK